MEEIKTPTLEKLIELRTKIAVRLYARGCKVINSFDNRIEVKPIDKPQILWGVEDNHLHKLREDGSIAFYKFRTSSEDLYLSLKETGLVLGDNYWYPDNYSHYPPTEDIHAMFLAEYKKPTGANAYILGQIQLGDERRVCPIQYFKISFKDYKRKNSKRDLKFCINEVNEERKGLNEGNK